MSIKTIIDSLSSEARQAIMTAFDSNLSHLVEYEPGKFVGVNLTTPAANVKIEESIGKWSVGTIKKGE